jgi:hypothetical protein
MRSRFLCRSPLSHSTSGVMQEPPQGSFIWLFGAPEIPVSTENSESVQKSTCPAVVSRACSYSSRRFFHGSLVGFAARAELELKVIALSHQLAVLNRQRPGRPRLFALDRLFWNWLYRVWPRCLNIIVLVKPATVVQWHRQGFRLYWRWRSRSGRPSVGREVRDLILQVNTLTRSGVRPASTASS